MSQAPPKPVNIGKYLDAIFPSYAMLAGMQLNIFTHLKDDAKSAEELAGSLNVNVEQLSVLLYALAAAKLLTVADGTFANTDESAFYLVEGSPAYLGDLHPILSEMWGALPFTAETIRTGSPQAHIDYHKDEVPEEMKGVYAGLHKFSLMSSRDLLQHFDLSSHKHIADIGGGTGGLSIALTGKFPDLQASVIDLPASLKEARDYIEHVPHKDRIHLIEHDVVSNPIDAQFDGAVMRAFTQVLSPEQNHHALKYTFDALEPGGSLYIIARITNDTRSTPELTALFNLVFLNLYDGGRAFPESDYREWLGNAGFVDIERVTLPRGDSIIRAQKPA